MGQLVAPKQKVQDRSKKAQHRRALRKNQGYRSKHKINGQFKVVKRGKYNNKGRWEQDLGTGKARFFHSGVEADRFLELQKMVEGKKIERLECQPGFPIVIKGITCGSYKADFRYIHISETGRRTQIVEDVKGMRTDMYKFKKKLTEAGHGIVIWEIPGPLVKKGLTAGLVATEIDMPKKFPKSRGRKTVVELKSGTVIESDEKGKWDTPTA